MMLISSIAASAQQSAWEIRNHDSDPLTGEKARTEYVYKDKTAGAFKYDTSKGIFLCPVTENPSKLNLCEDYHVCQKP